MIRLIGVLTGSALAIGLLLLLLGVPELGREPVDEWPDTPIAGTAVPQAPPQPEAPQANEQETESLVEPKPVAEAEPVAESEPVPETAAPVDTNPEPVATGTVVENGVAKQDEADTQYWYAFWSPFRSRIAADGFVSELSRTTGLDYRVVKLKPGVFEVAVAYTDDADIEDKLTRISAATGLDMSGG